MDLLSLQALLLIFVTLKMNLLSNMDEVVDSIIRPARYIYKPMDLGSRSFNVNGQVANRTDFEVKNARGMTLKGSVYSLKELKQISQVLVYLHCNSGCRIEGLAYCKLALQHGFSYVVFDFAGSGISEGSHVTLGFYEVDDLKAVIHYLRQISSQTLAIGLWGRSMGAVTALRYLKQQANIQVAVFDSPFQSLRSLFVELGRQRTNLPRIVLEMAYKYVKPKVMEKADFDIDEVDFTISQLCSYCPGVFLASKQDDLVPFKHIDSIFTQYKGEKEMFFLEESHNEPRNQVVIEKVFKAIKRFFRIGQPLNPNKPNYYSFLPQKESNKRKLELTLNSHSQKLLGISGKNNTSSTPNHEESRKERPALDRKHISCFLAHKKPMKAEKIHFAKSESVALIKQKQIKIKNFFREKAEKPMEQNNNIANQIHFNRKEGTKPSVVINLQGVFDETIKQGKQGKSRKTMQHISRKKPPLREINNFDQYRGSLESKIRQQIA